MPMNVRSRMGFNWWGRSTGESSLERALAANLWTISQFLAELQDQ